jgi:hypothetical protein
MLSELLIAELDERVAFTSAQREKLRPIAEQLVKNTPALMKPKGVQSLMYNSNGGLFGVALAAKEEQMKGILDPVQWARWKAVCEEEKRGESPRSRRNRSTPAPPAESTSEQMPEPELVEEAISEFFQKKAVEQRAELVERMLLKAEDASRVVKFDEATLQRLQTAARGAAEKTLLQWKENTARNLRSNLRNVVPENVRLRLASLQDYQFRGNREEVPEKLGVWEKTVATALTEEQRAAWEKEVKARGAWRAQAIAKFILREVDERYSLAREQREKLLAALGKVLEDYGPDIDGYFSHSSGGWFYQTYQMFSPFHGVPEAELKAILSKEQWEGLSGSQEFGNGDSYWSSIKSLHDRRVDKASKS